MSVPSDVTKSHFWRALPWVGLGISIAICFITKVYLFWPLCETFGTYPGDVWYMYDNYGKFFNLHAFFRMEYPVGIFAFVKFSYVLTGLIFSRQFNYFQFMLVNSFLLSLFAFGTLWLILSMISTLFPEERSIHIRLLWFFVFAPTMLHLALHNYDFPAIFFMFLSIYYYFREDEVFSSVYLSLGAAIKLFPALLLPLMLLKRWKSAKVIIPVFISVWLAMNIPAMVVNFRDWIFPYLWQAERTPPPCESLGYWSHMYLGKMGSLLLFVVVYLVALIIFHRGGKKDSTGDSPREFLMQAACLLGIFFVFNKIYSPQYMLWLLPFFVFAPGIPIFLFWFLDLGNVAVNFFHFKLIEPKWQWINAVLVVVRTIIIPYIILTNLSMVKRSMK